MPYLYAFIGGMEPGNQAETDRWFEITTRAYINNVFRRLWIFPFEIAVEFRNWHRKGSSGSNFGSQSSKHCPCYAIHSFYILK